MNLRHQLVRWRGVGEYSAVGLRGRGVQSCSRNGHEAVVERCKADIWLSCYTKPSIEVWSAFLGEGICMFRSHSESLHLQSWIIAILFQISESHAFPAGNPAEDIHGYAAISYPLIPDCRDRMAPHD